MAEQTGPAVSSVYRHLMRILRQGSGFSRGMKKKRRRRKEVKKRGQGMRNRRRRKIKRIRENPEEQQGK